MSLSKSSYSTADLDLNGQIQNTDLAMILYPNLGRGQQFSGKPLTTTATTNLKATKPIVSKEGIEILDEIVKKEKMGIKVTKAERRAAKKKIEELQLSKNKMKSVAKQAKGERNIFRKLMNGCSSGNSKRLRSAATKFKRFNYLIKNKNFINSLVSNVTNTIALIKKKKFNSIVLNYDERSNDLFYWYQQLVAESLGKKQKGIFPLNRESNHWYKHSPPKRHSLHHDRIAKRVG